MVAGASRLTQSPHDVVGAGVGPRGTPLALKAVEAPQVSAQGLDSVIWRLLVWSGQLRKGCGFGMSDMLQSADRPGSCLGGDVQSVGPGVELPSPAGLGASAHDSVFYAEHITNC